MNFQFSSYYPQRLIARNKHYTELAKARDYKSQRATFFFSLSVVYFTKNAFVYVIYIYINNWLQLLQALSSSQSAHVVRLAANNNVTEMETLRDNIHVSTTNVRSLTVRATAYIIDVVQCLRDRLARTINQIV